MEAREIELAPPPESSLVIRQHQALDEALDHRHADITPRSRR